MATASDILQALQALNKTVTELVALTQLSLLNQADSTLTSMSNPISIGTANTGTRVYKNTATRPVAVIVRDRGGTAQTIRVSKSSSMIPSDGFGTSGTANRTTESEPTLLLPDESVFASASSSEVVVDAIVLDPLALVKRLIEQ